MPDDDGRGAAIGEHFGGNLAGESTARLDVAILGADADAGAERLLRREMDESRGRTNDELARMAKLGIIAARHEGDLAERLAQPVHLPIADDQRARLR